MPSITSYGGLMQAALQARTQNYALFLADHPHLAEIAGALVPDEIESEGGYEATHWALTQLLIAAGDCAAGARVTFTQRLKSLSVPAARLTAVDRALPPGGKLPNTELYLLVAWCGSELARLSHFFGEGQNG